MHMERIVIRNFDLQPNKQEIFKLINCQEDSFIYDKTSKLYESLKILAYDLIKPKAVITFDNEINDLKSEYLNKCTTIIYVIMTLGSQISDKVTELFKAGKYLDSIILNGIADYFIFNMENILIPKIKSECLKKGLGLQKRLEISNELLLESQKIILEKTKAKELINLDMTNEYMLEPIKSYTFVLGANDCVSNSNIEHSCNGCMSINCKMKKIKIKLHFENEIKILLSETNKNLMQILNNNNIDLPFICAGKSICGKCGIQLINGSLMVTETDKKFYSTQELEEGYRLACAAYPYEDIEILLFNNEKNIQAVSTYTKINNLAIKQSSDTLHEYGLAIDIGTTTIALELINITNKKSVKTYTLINHQRIFGADVISRIDYSIKGNKKELRNIIQKDILDGLTALFNTLKIDKNSLKINKIIISANTAMIHLLMGFDCEGLGMFPFTPFTLKKLEYSFNEVFESDLFKANIIIMPSISAYIGADITSGLLMCNFDKKDSIQMLIDIGTNGEMAIGNQTKILCTSASAGPALEGGNISCGIGSIEGAISKINIEHNTVYYTTIGTKPPLGICGSGVIDITAEALKNKLIDSTGLLKEELFDEGIKVAVTIKGKTINFTQKDFRQVQMAKAAIRAGIDTLIKEYDCNIEDIDTIYISGGFGYHININNAIAIGLLPKSFKGKIRIIGNSSLGGASYYLLDNESDIRIEKILNLTQEIYLANDNNFNELFINSMYF